MKGNIKRVLAATGLVIAVLLVAVSAFPGSTALAQGGNGNSSSNGNNNGNGNSKAPYVKCVNGQLVLYEWTMNQNGSSNSGGSNNNQGKWMQTIIGTCASNTDAILNQLAKQYGLTRAQLDALVAIEFRNGGIPQAFDLQTWFNNYMANQNGTNNSTNSSSSTSTSSNSTTSTNQSGSTGTSTGTNQSGSTSTSTGTNAGRGGAAAPATLPTTGGGLDTVSPLVLAFGAILMALGLGVYKVSATR